MEKFEEIDLKDCIVGGTVHCTEYSGHNGESGSDAYDDETGKVTKVYKA